MDITLSHRSALEALRSARVAAGKKGLTVTTTDIVNPSRDDGGRWTNQAITELKAAVGLPQGQRVDVMVRERSRRIRNTNVACHVWNSSMRGLHFIELGNGVTIPSPEILLVQLAETLPLAEVVALGHELCGKYSLTSSKLSSAAETCIPAVTSSERIYQTLKDCKGIHGAAALREALAYVRDGSLSPMETCLSTMAQLPLKAYGYQLGEVTLNRTIVPDEGTEDLVLASSRTPDILFSGTTVGINYDGDVHLDLDAIVTAAQALAKSPWNTEHSVALDAAITEARRSVARDKQRDRDLLAMGYTVLPVTKFDLQTIRDLDRVMKQVMLFIERTTGHDLALQRAALSDADLQRGREALLRSLFHC